MSFFGNFIGSERKEQGKISFIERASDIILTNKGKNRLERLEPVGIEYRVMCCIRENEPVSVGEISQKEQIPEYKTREIVRELIRKGWVMVKND